jgi:hypothetical protein
MTAAFATLAFLTVLWMLAVVTAQVLDRSGARIVAALKGESMKPSLATQPVRLRHQRYLPARAMRVSARRRAAA